MIFKEIDLKNDCHYRNRRLNIALNLNLKYIQNIL